MTRCARLIAALAVIAATALTSARPAEASTGIKVQLVTFGPGDDVWQRFGHNALLLALPDGRISLFNYGNVEFGPGLLGRYMQQKLDFWVTETAADTGYRAYVDADRTVTLQHLDLPDDAIVKLTQRLFDDVRPENKYYRYHHYWDNCSTKVRDVLDEALDGQLAAALDAPARMSLRAHTRRYASVDPLLDFALLFWMNDDMDGPIRRWDEMFLPEELRAAVADFSWVDASGAARPLVRLEEAVHASSRAPILTEPPPLTPFTLAIGLLVGGIAVLLGRRARTRRAGRILLGSLDALVGLAFGVLGLAGAVMWAFSEHIVTFENENLLLANPLTALLLLLGIAYAIGWRWAARAIRWVHLLLATGAVLALLLKVLPAFDQRNAPVIALLLPLNLGLLLAHRLADAPPAGAGPVRALAVHPEPPPA